MKYTKSSSLLVLAFLGFAQSIMSSQDTKNELKPELWTTINATSIFIAKGDITKLRDIDAIVSPAHNTLQHWAGVAGAISMASGSPEEGSFVWFENKTLKTKLQIHCNDMLKDLSVENFQTGYAIISPAFDLKKERNIEHIIHAVGPLGMAKDPITKQSTKVKGRKKMLQVTYQNTLKVAQDNKVKSMAFCVISRSGYRIQKTAPIALAAVRDFIKSNPNGVPSKIIFVLNNEEDYAEYKNNEHVLSVLAQDESAPEKELDILTDDSSTQGIKSDTKIKENQTNSTSFSFKKLFYIVPVGLLGILIWHIWRTAAK